MCTFCKRAAPYFVWITGIRWIYCYRYLLIYLFSVYKLEATIHVESLVAQTGVGVIVRIDMRPSVYTSTAHEVGLVSANAPVDRSMIASAVDVLSTPLHEDTSGGGGGDVSALALMAVHSTRSVAQVHAPASRASCVPLGQTLFSLSLPPLSGDRSTQTRPATASAQVVARFLLLRPGYHDLSLALRVVAARDSPEPLFLLQNGVPSTLIYVPPNWYFLRALYNFYIQYVLHSRSHIQYV